MRSEDVLVRVAEHLQGLNAVADVETQRADGSVVTNARAARQVEVVQADVRLRRRDVAGVAERGGAQRPRHVEAQLDRGLPEGEAPDGDLARGVLAGGR